MVNFEYVLSLVMPTYNRAKEIQVSIKTLLDTLPHSLFQYKIELLILDNGSSYDVEDILKEIIILSEKKLSIRIIKNSKNIGNDQNFLNGLCEAKGKYILQCSDRYYYNLDFASLIPMLENETTSCIIFSDRFRKYTNTAISLNNSYKDKWLEGEFKILKENNTFFEINTQELINSSYIKSGLINSFSDLILINKGKKYFENKLNKFINSHMLGVTAQLDAISESKNIKLLRINMNSVVHQNIGNGNLYNRHDYNEVYYGNVLIQKIYNFIGTSNEIKLAQINGLIDLYLKNKAGLYYALIKPDKILINKTIKNNNLTLKWYKKIDLFLINTNTPPFIIRWLIMIKDFYLLIKREYKKVSSDRTIVNQLKNDLNK